MAFAPQLSCILELKDNYGNPTTKAQSSLTQEVVDFAKIPMTTWSKLMPVMSVQGTNGKFGSDSTTVAFLLDTGIFEGLYFDVPEKKR